MNNSKKYSRLMSIIIAVAMVFSVMVFLPEDVSAATKKPGKVKITKAIKMNRIITVKWKKAKNAKKYQIYLKEGKKKWKKVATVKSSKRSYSIKKLKWNTKYQLKMRAVNGKKKGKWSRIYKGKLDKKTTLQAFVKKNKSLQKELNQLENKLNKKDGISANVELVGNTIKIVESYAGEDFSDSLSEVKSVIEKEFNNAKMKKAFKKDIARIENNTGIFGIKFRIVIYDGVGNQLLDYTYK